MTKTRTVMFMAIATFALAGLLLPVDSFATTNGTLGNMCAKINDPMKKLDCRRDMSDQRDANNNERYENQKGLKATQEIKDLQELQKQRSQNIISVFDEREDLINEIKDKKKKLSKAISDGDKTTIQLLRSEVQALLSEDRALRDKISDLVDELEKGCITLHMLWEKVNQQM